MNDWFLKLVSPSQALLTANDRQVIERYRQILSSSADVYVHIKPFQEILKRKQPALPGSIAWGDKPSAFEESWWSTAAEYSQMMAAIFASLLGVKNNEWDQNYIRTRHGWTVLAKLGVYGFAHPSAIQEIGQLLKNLGVDTLVDLCAGSGFLPMMFTTIAHFKVFAFDKATPLTGIAPHAALLYPVICNTDYQSIDLKNYDWNRTAICLSWPDKPGDPVISLGILEKAVEAGVRFLLVCTDHDVAFTSKFEAKCRQFYQPISREFYAMAGLEKTLNCYIQIYRIGV